MQRTDSASQYGSLSPSSSSTLSAASDFSLTSALCAFPSGGGGGGGDSLLSPMNENRQHSFGLRTSPSAAVFSAVPTLESQRSHSNQMNSIATTGVDFSPSYYSLASPLLQFPTYPNNGWSCKLEDYSIFDHRLENLCCSIAEAALSGGIFIRV